MIGDQELMFSDGQDVTAAAASTNTIDFGPLASGNAYRDVGAGDEEMWLVLTVTVAFTDGGSDSTLAVKWETDDNESFSSATDLWDIVTIGALTAAGTQYKYRIPPANYERYNRLYYTPANGDLTTGTIQAQLFRDVTFRRDYAGQAQSSAD